MVIQIDYMVIDQIDDDFFDVVPSSEETSL